jgi:hypothetical protein
MIQIQNHNIDRRKHPRADLKINMHCSSLSGTRESMLSQIRMVDMSQSGIGAESNRKFQRDERVILHLPKGHQEMHKHLFARVAWCVSSSYGYKVGLEFETDILPEANTATLAA